MTNAHQIKLGLSSTKAADLKKWALPRLQPFLPLDALSLSETLSYALSLPNPEAAADHWRGLLGEDGAALEFISGFGLRFSRLLAEQGTGSNGGTALPARAAAPPVGWDHVPAVSRRVQKQKPALGAYKQMPRRPGEGTGFPQNEQDEVTFRAYRKEDSHENFLQTSAPSSKPSSGTSTPQKQRSRLADSLAVSDQASNAAPPFTAPPTPSSVSKPPTKADPSSIQPSPTISRSVTAPKQPPSARTPLISDPDAHVPKPLKKNKKTPSTRHPATATLKFTGGKQMHAPAPSQLSDLDQTIRALELQAQNPPLPTTTATSTSKSSPNTSTTTTADPTTAAAAALAARHCNCMATRHPLLTAIPNCLACGQIICVKQGLGPCVSCGSPLLAPEQLQGMLRALREERGKERMGVHNGSGNNHGGGGGGSGNSRSARNSGRASPMPNSKPTHDPLLTSISNPAATTTLSAAEAHRDRLLSYQRETTSRTTIRDEAADYDATPTGPAGNRWLDVRERALALRKQQRILAEREWEGSGEWEKRRVVVALEGEEGGKLKGVRRMEEIERPDFAAEAEEALQGDEDGAQGGEPSSAAWEEKNEGNDKDKGKGKAKRDMHANPLGKRLIVPIWRPANAVPVEQDPGTEEERKAAREERRKERRAARGQAWSRIQDGPADDEEEWDAGEGGLAA